MNSTLPIAPKKSLEENAVSKEPALSKAIPAPEETKARETTLEQSVSNKDEQFNTTMNLTGSYGIETYIKNGEKTVNLN